jgi:hypothetical protein
MRLLIILLALLPGLALGIPLTVCYECPTTKIDGSVFTCTGAEVYEIYRIDAGVLRFDGRTTELCHSTDQPDGTGFVVRIVATDNTFSQITPIVKTPPPSLDGTPITDLIDPNSPVNTTVSPD